MGDRVTVLMGFGGKLHRSKLPEFIELLKDGGFLSRDMSDDRALTAISNSSFDVLDADEVNYANTEEIDDFCRMYGVDFDKQHEAGGGYGAQIIQCRKGEITEYPMANGGAMVALSEVLTVEALTTGLADLLTKAKAWNDPLPSFELVG